MSFCGGKGGGGVVGHAAMVMSWMWCKYIWVTTASARPPVHQHRFTRWAWNQQTRVAVIEPTPSICGRTGPQFTRSIQTYELCANKQMNLSFPLFAPAHAFFSFFRDRYRIVLRHVSRLKVVLFLCSLATQSALSNALLFLYIRRKTQSTVPTSSRRQANVGDVGLTSAWRWRRVIYSVCGRCWWWIVTHSPRGYSQ